MNTSRFDDDLGKKRKQTGTKVDELSRVKLSLAIEMDGKPNYAYLQGYGDRRKGTQWARGKRIQTKLNRYEFKPSSDAMVQ